MAYDLAEGFGLEGGSLLEGFVHELGQVDEHEAARVVGAECDFAAGVRAYGLEVWVAVRGAFVLDGVPEQEAGFGAVAHGGDDLVPDGACVYEGALVFEYLCVWFAGLDCAHELIGDSHAYVRACDFGPVAFDIDEGKDFGVVYGQG